MRWGKKERKERKRNEEGEEEVDVGRPKRVKVDSIISG